MAPRRTHTKSRRGCTPCKQRKVKCDEATFRCGNCIKRDLKCSYSTPQHSTAILDHSPRSPPNGHHDSEDAARVDHPAGLRIARPSHEPYSGLGRSEELCLVHHYVNWTCESLSFHSEDTAVWRSAVFEDSIRFPFVLDAVLALASLHRATSSPEKGQEYTSSSLYHESRGLQGYAEQLANITQGNCQAVFAFSMLINVLTIAASVGFPGLPPVLPIDTLFAAFELLRGIEVVYDASSTMLMASPYRVLFSKKKRPVRAKKQSQTSPMRCRSYVDVLKNANRILGEPTSITRPLTDWMRLSKSSKAAKTSESSSHGQYS